MKEAMEQRHVVRKYREDPIPDNLAAELEQRAAAIGSAEGLTVKLMLNDGDQVNAVGKLTSKNVRNYFIIAGEPQEDLDVRGGYAAADLMLFAQTLGLNTWYIGGMTSKKTADKVPGLNVVTAVAVGFGITQGEPHVLKTSPEQVADLEDAPQWFVDGVNAALYAPTAMNKQAFAISRDGNRVTMTVGKGRFALQDKGLLMYHFEIWAGKENFEWA